VLAAVLFVHPLAASYVCQAASTPGQAEARLDAHKRRDKCEDHQCSSYAFRGITFETLGRFSPGAMQLICEATLPAFPT
jgi:hypothetical protein